VKKRSFSLGFILFSLLSFVIATLVTISVKPPASEAATQNYTAGSTTDFVVPDGVTSIDVTVVGGKGADGTGSEYIGTGGFGATVTATIDVTPGETLRIVVGSNGADGGANGGGSGASSGGYGGGATDVRQGGTTLSDRVLVAGGGGGGGGGGLTFGATPDPSSQSGDGGDAGFSAHDGAPGEAYPSSGGHGATLSAAGTGGVGGGTGGDGSSATGGSSTNTANSGGGGGGGYFGGGSGASAGYAGGAGGGGAGSSYADESASDVSITTDTTGTPLATLTYTVLQQNDISVSSCEQLNDVGQDMSNIISTITLTQNIYCDDVDFVPMFQGSDFSGEFDGQGHTISHLTIDSSTNNSGLISSITDGANVHDVTIESGQVIAGDGVNYVGALVGYMSGGSISAAGSQIPLTCSDTSVSCGGLIGYVEATDEDIFIADSYAIGGVRGGINNIGGFVGTVRSINNNKVDFRRDFSAGLLVSNVAQNAVGGFAGSTFLAATTDTNASIINSYSRVDVVAPNASQVGGLIGIATINASSFLVDVEQVVHNSFSAGSMQGHNAVGGIVGYVEEGDYGYFALQNSFATGNMTGDLAVGGLIGLNGETGAQLQFENNYWDKTRTGASDFYGGGAFASGNNVGVPVNTDGSQSDYFFNNSTTGPFAGDDGLIWDIPDTWTLHANNFPSLNSVGPEDELPGPNDGDANNDTIPDNIQTNVQTFLEESSNKWVTIELNPGNTIFDFGQAQFGLEDPGFTYPWGYVGFSALVTQGATVPVKVYFHDVDNADFTAKKVFAGTQTFETIDDAEINYDANSRTVSVAYDVTDGSHFDLDETANGTIIDPLALAANPLPSSESVIPAPGATNANGTLANTGAVIGSISFIGVTLILAGLFMIQRRRNLMRISR
jgi:hypothetical protein